ncbi:MAG: sporulation protein YtfJ [Oscillospiraceae bacterium]|jgi:sporulation protein YtfJ|nr:sporulation protein YtfJ [Oscillospiraceae bacterium]
MSTENNIQGILDATLEKMKVISDADTIIGQPIALPDGVTVIPVSKVTVGFASGGADFPSKSINQKLFGGGTGAGVTISPVAFIVASGGDVKILQVYKEASTAERAIALVPDLFDKIGSLFKKDKKSKEEKPEDSATL